MKEKYKIGQKIGITQDFEIETFAGGNKLQVKQDDEGFIDSLGNVNYTTGQARGKMQHLGDVEIKGYDVHNIADIIYKRLKN